MADSFSSILDRPLETAERPKPTPTGTYTAMILPEYKIDKSTKQQTDYVEYKFKLLQPHDDVDQEELAAIKNGIQSREMRKSFYLTEDSLYRLTAFLDCAGVEWKGKSPRQFISEAPGHQVNLQVIHKPTADKQGLFADISDNGFSAV
jgi:hypothetical protein